MTPDGLAKSQSCASFKELVQAVEQKGLFRITPGLKRIAAVFTELNLTRLPFPVIQVIGSNGKGSTSTMLGSIASAYGLRVGVYTSPHFVSVTERIRINNTPLSEQTWFDLGTKLNQAGGETLSYFEWLTALAAMAFKYEQTDIAIFEAGLGGTWDATTALEPDIIVYTPIDLDHENILGETIAAITADKAGAIRNGAQVISGLQHPEAKEILINIAQERSSPILFCSAPLPDTVNLTLSGPHQQANAAIALCAWRTISEKFFKHSDKVLATQQPAHPASDEAHAAPCKCTSGTGLILSKQEQEALANAWLPGRIQQVVTAEYPSLSSTPLAAFESILLDGAHNPHSLSALVDHLHNQKKHPHILMFACLQDKDLEHILPFIQFMQPQHIFVPPIKENPRAFSPEVLASLLASKIHGSTHSVLSLEEGFEKAKKLIEQVPPTPQSIPLVITGSLYLLGDVFSLFPALLSPPAGTR